MNSNYFVYLSSSVVEYKMSKHIFSNIEKIGYFQYLKIFTCYPTTDERLEKRVLLYILECDIFFKYSKICLHVFNIWLNMSSLTNLWWVSFLNIMCWNLSRNACQLCIIIFSVLNQICFSYSGRFLYVSQLYWGFFIFIAEKDFATFNELFSLAFFGPFLGPLIYLANGLLAIIKK